MQVEVTIRQKRHSLFTIFLSVERLSLSDSGSKRTVSNTLNTSKSVSSDIQTLKGG